jgi:endonuclease/exonuclease/phosphatase (EEP) superfamily protein YafD
MLLDEIGEGDPVVMIGDFNYPLFRSGLERVAERDGFSVSLSDEPTYRHSASVSTHFDLLTSRGMRVHEVRTLPSGASDHRPILVHADVAPATVHPDAGRLAAR